MGQTLSLKNQPIIVDMDSPKAVEIQAMIADNKIIIFSKSYCPYCRMAKEAFAKLDVQPTIVELDGRDDCEEVQTILGQLTGSRTVPRCFISGEFVGGGTDVKKLYETGKLKALCA